MPPVVIENPILNSAFAEPTGHFRFDEAGITNDIVDESHELCLASLARWRLGRAKRWLINHYGDEVLKVYDIAAHAV